ncbi:MAG: hypothetical protein OEZ06_13220 [Myxococcales bacterium]|nr:hypothetical protein [Myxococcales bacterium]
MYKLGLRTLLSVLAIAWIAQLAGCGDDGGGDAEGSAGTGSDALSQTANPGSTATGTTTTTTSVLPDGGVQALIDMLQPTCDPNVPTTANCGGTECPAPGGLAQFTCTVPCCQNDTCGTMSAVEGMVGECQIPAQPDPNCPGYEAPAFSGFGMGAADNDAGAETMTLPGCCTAEGVCGVISSFTQQCITSSMIYTDITAGPPCGQ